MVRSADAAGGGCQHHVVRGVGRVVCSVIDTSTTELATFFEDLPDDAPALFGVSWAGEQTSEGWFDVGREFTELWHHQEQIRLAVGAPSLRDPWFLHAVIEIAVRGLPHAYRAVDARAGDSVVIAVSGPAGGVWTLVRSADRWTIHAGEPPNAVARAQLSDEAAWRLLFNGLKGDAARSAMNIEGQADLATPLLAARSIVV